MNRNRILLYHILGWLLLLSYDLFSIYRNEPPGLSRVHSFVLQATFRLSLVVVFYYCFLLIYPRFLRRSRVVPLVLLLPSMVMVFAGTRYLLEEVLLPLLFGFRNYTPGTKLTYYVLDNIYYCIPTVMVAAAAWSVQDALLQEKKRETQALLHEKTQAELAFLRTQINPHFLYNTLNYIYSLAYPVSEPLAEAVLRLSDLMRYMLHESPDGQVELAAEVEYLESYLSIFRLRFEDKFFVTFEQSGAPVSGQRVAALLLIPFVENALKHGVVNKAEYPVTIRLHLPAPDRLEFEVHNYVGPHQKDATTGIGLGNVRRRLELLYPGRHQLTIRPDAQQHHAHLTLQL